MSEASGGGWKCMHCPLEVTGLPPGIAIEICPGCKRPQLESVNKPSSGSHDLGGDSKFCNNPDCKSKNFDQAATKECEACRAEILHAEKETSKDKEDKSKQPSSEKSSSPEKPVNPKTEPGKVDHTNPQSPKETDSSEPMDESLHVNDPNIKPPREVKKLAANQKTEIESQNTDVGNIQPDGNKPQSVAPGRSECVNPSCKELLITGNTEVCPKCQTQQSRALEKQSPSNSKLKAETSSQVPPVTPMEITKDTEEDNIQPDGTKLQNATPGQSRESQKQSLDISKKKPEASSHVPPVTPMEITKKDTPTNDNKNSSVGPSTGSVPMDTNNQPSEGKHSQTVSTKGEGFHTGSQQPKNESSRTQLTVTKTDPLIRSPLGKRPNGSDEHANKISKITSDEGGVNSDTNGLSKSYAAAASENTSTNEKQKAYKRPAYDQQEEFVPGTKSQQKPDPATSNSNPNYNLRPRDNLSGLNPSDPKKALFVIFHVLVPLEAWSWDSQTTMHMRFGHQKLGQWKVNVGTFEQKGYAQDGLAEMQCILKLDIDLFSSTGKHIPYKYVIFSPQRLQSEEGSKAFFESFHDCPTWFGGGIINRSLDIPKDHCIPQGTYHHFDSMSFPHAKSKPVLMRVWDGLKGLVRSSDKKTDSLHVPSHDSMQKKCLEVYLEISRKILCDCDLSPQIDICAMKNWILHIYNKLYCQKMENYMQRDWKSNSLTENLRDWLFEVVKDLCSKKCHTFLEHGRRMASVLCIVDSLYSIVPDRLPWYKLDLDTVGDILSMLILSPSSERQQCPDLDVILTLLPEISRQPTANSVRSLCTHLSYHRLLRNPQWLCAIPLVHVLQKKITPFAKPELNPESIVWIDRQFGLTHVKSKTSNLNLSLVEKHFNQLNTLAELDPLFLPIVVFVCPVPELPSLFLLIPPYLSITRISIIVNETKGMLNKKEIAENSQLIKAVLEVVKSHPEKEARRSYETLEAALNASELLLSRLTSKLPGRDMLYTDTVKLVVSTLFYSASNFQLACDNAEKLKAAEKCVYNVFKNIIYYFESWIKRGFGGAFGLPERMKFSLAHTELKVWLSLIGLDCPQELRTKWHDMVQQMIRSRVAKVPSALRIDLLGILESDRTMQTLITNVFVEGAMQALEKMDSEDTLASVQRLYQGGMYQQRETVGRVLERILERTYARETQLITVDQLLEWELWPIYINVYKSEALMTQEVGRRVQSCLPVWCTIVCTCADSTLDSICNQLKGGDITLEELKKITKKSDQMKALCAAHIHRTDPNYTQETSAMQTVLQRRMTELQHFTRTTELLGFLCERISVKVLGLGELRAQLKENYSSVPIKKLCPRTGVDSNLVKECCFKSAAPISNIIVQFDMIARRLSSELFTKIWQETVKKASKTIPKLTIPHIVTEMWDPTIISCGALLEGVHGCTIKLCAVDFYFKEHSKKTDRIILNLHNLYNGLQFCHGESQEKTCPPWIRSAVDRMHQYWTLQQYAEAAEILLDLKAKLSLTGDFGLIETLAHRMSTSMKDQMLAAVDARLIEAGQFLKELLAEDSRLESLRVFADCMEIVDWVRKETKEVNRLHNFVSLALHTAAGEGDYASDRLSNLKIVGFGYGPLIYGLKTDTSFESFRNECRAVWETLKEQPNLPELLRSCNAELDYYKNVKQTQASVEVTSFDQMNNIHRYGCYKIGSNHSEIFHNIDDVIHMSLEESGRKRLVHTRYSLNELRDLESKLVLITGSNAENRAEVDRFLDTLHGVCRIADVLISLQQVGNVKYIGWVFEVPCSGRNVGELQEQAKSMEQELEKWKEELKNRREQFYELNYYTTLQLLTLRRELGHVKATPSALLNPEVATLLKSISLQISPSSAPQLVRNVISSLANRRLPLQSVRDSEIPELSPKASLDKRSNIESSQVMEGSVVSNRVSLSKEVLASADVQTAMDTQKNDEPRLSVDSLTVEQAEILTYCQERFDFSQILVLKAFEECGKDATPYDVENWCVENADKYQHLEQTTMETDHDDSYSESDEDEAMSNSSSESDAEMAPYTPPVRAAHDQPLEPSVASSVHGIAQVQVAQKPLVDKYNPTVVELMSAGFGLDQSIAAVKRYETLDAAMEYLMSAGDSEETGLFHTSDYERQLSDEQIPVEQSWNAIPTIKCDNRTAEKFLSLVELGNILEELRKNLPQAILVQRPFNSRVLKSGSPNLLVTSPDRVLRTTLALYMENEDEAFPLPTPEEVLVCNSCTTAEEVNLLWMRAINDYPDYRRIFCLVHAEKLSYQVCDNVLQSLSEYTQGKSEYRLVVICSNEEEEKSHLISKLHNFKKQYVQDFDDRRYQKYLRRHFTGQVEALYTQQQTIAYSTAKASAVDHEISRVRVVASTRSGMGKSLRIKRMAEQLRMNLNQEREHHVTIPLHGPVVTPDRVLDFLQEHTEDSECTIYHFDIAPSVLKDVDTILFSLLILSGLTDSQGRVWRCHPSQMYAVEVTLPEEEANLQITNRSIPEARTLALLKLLPTVMCVSPLESMRLLNRNETNPSVVLMDNVEFESSMYQRVYQYLRRHIGGYNLDTFSYTANVEGTAENCLEVITSKCGVRDPSWSEICHFVEFFNIQLQSCEDSVFCDETLVGDVMSGLKGFVVKFMIRMSRDFATSSMKGEVARENMEAQDGNDDLEQYEIVQRRLWEQNSHPYIFFNQDRVSITFVGFKVTRTGDLVEPADGRVLEPSIISQQLYTGLVQNRVNFEDDYRNWHKGVMIEKIATVMGIEFPHDPDDTYVLTVDNLIKMLAIQMRFRCGIPVVIMGETGCGKTRLIRYMCDLARQGYDRNNMLILKVHGGTTEKDIIDFVESATKEAQLNQQIKMDTVVFFDEANTTEAIGLIKEIMCDGRLNGKPVSKALKFIAACNPYRKHTDDMIEKLEAAGLGFAVRTTETLEKLGKIPLRQLVYRVLDLPPSMRPLVYDFGQLNTSAERDYVAQIVKEHVKVHPRLSQENPQIIPVISAVLTWSQTYMRGRKDECSFVSLRDVERAMIVFEYFYEKMHIFAPLMNEWIARLHRRDEDSDDEDVMEVAPLPAPNGITRALVLSVSVCYHARLREREEYENGVSGQFVQPLSLPGGTEQFRDEIRYCQEVLLDNMSLGENIARNAALRENVFMMAVCVELRIPLFLVGKPGSSKSLAKTIIHDSMRGRLSKTDLLKEFKEVTMLSYQCSQLSTPESVIEVFKTAKQWQSKQDTKKFVAVVVLDEVGLAEDSPNLPLKALHPLLEDGTEGASKKQYVDEIVAREERVAFIGISNWALDPAKMNRGVMVTRGDPSERELEFSARGICSNKPDDPIKDRLEVYFKPLAEGYVEICKNQLKEKQFFGLRDFYSLIKMLYWMCERTQSAPTWPQLQHAIMRNFGGLESNKFDPLDIFERKILINREPPDLSGFSEELHPILNPDCSRLGLIKTSLSSREKTWHGENRYLLFLTENYAALDILKHYLNDASLTHQTVEQQEKMEPFILFGSSFPKDKEYTQVCRNINQIKICMETGRTVILLNLENLYESLYDALNQYYIHSFGNRYVDLGLQTHRVKCRVHDNFKLILIAEKDTVYDKFPTPLINRLEKHFVLTSSVLEDWQKNVLRDFDEWIDKFCNVRGKTFKPGDAFIGFQKDTPAAVVFQATNHLKKIRESQLSFRENMIAGAGISPEELMDEDQESWSQAVLKLSQYLLLQTAAPDAVIRLKNTALAEKKSEILRIYFLVQHHLSIERFLNHHLHEQDVQNGLFIQVTTHSHLLSHEEVREVQDAISMEIAPFFLHEFDTELDFTNKLSPEFKRRRSNLNSRLVIIQCDSGHLNADLIACARYRIYDVKARPDNTGVTHVLFIIHLSHHQEKSLFVGFQGDPWLSVHIDDLRPTSEYSITPEQAMHSSISELFLGSKVQKEVVAPMEVLLEQEMETEGEPTIEEPEEMEQEFPSDSHLENEDMQVDEQPTDVGSETSSIEIDRPEMEFDPGAIQGPSSGAASLPPQYRRLHGCIQAAASRLQDTAARRRATKRVEILVNLVPKEPCLPLDDTTFLGILVMHIHKVLEERDQISDSNEDWALIEALDPKKLHSGGTFRNVLARKIDDVIIPIFAEIIAYIDVNYNLDLIGVGKENEPLSQFWLAMFRNPEIMQFSYKAMTVARNQVPGVGGRRSEDVFQCRLPFSWLIKKTIDSQWDNVKSSAGNNFKKLNEVLSEAIQQTPVGEVLEVVEGAECEEFYHHYLHDFVRMVHSCHHRKLEKEDLNDVEYKLIANAVNVMVHDPDISSIDGRESLIRRVAAVHVVYMMNSSQIMWFGQLTASEPGILLPLKTKEPPDSSEMVLHLHAVERTLDSLAPPLDKDTPTEHLVPWLNRVRCSQNAISSIINLPTQNGSLPQIKRKWQLIRVMQLFLEHVLLKHDQVPVAYARRLELFLRSDSDFLKASTLGKVKRSLNQIDNDLKTKKKLTPETLRSIKRSCRQFFIEVVSSLCFGGACAPEPDLVKMLMEIVFNEKSESGVDELETRDLTPYDPRSDRIPTIRSFLLQLLLEHNDQFVRDHLNEYFIKSLRVTGNEVDQDLSLLCVQCFEDSLHKKVSSLLIEEKTRRTVELLNEGRGILRHCVENSITRNSLEYLEGIAQLRFALSVVAESLHQPHSIHTANILHTAREVCLDPVINSIDESGTKDVFGPAMYLLKLLVRQYGLPSLQKAAEAYAWLIPESLKTTDEEEKVIDSFAIYNESGYSGLRECVSGAAYGKQLEGLVETTKVVSIKEAALLLLSFYQKVTLSRASTLPSKQILPDVLEGLDQTIVASATLNQEMKWAAQAMIANQQGGPLAQLSVRPHQPMECRILSALVVHTATVFSAMQAVEILHPFINMLANPANLINAYLPTMQEDYLQEARRVMGGQFYACSRGHPYFVGECGRPVEERTCRTCSAPIGGVNHRLRSDNVQARRNDATQTGHDLGDASGRSVPAPERYLSPPAVCIIRALMHSAFIWASCNNNTAIEGLSQLVKPRVPADSLPEFFWRHLEKDIEQLRMVTGRAESALIVHLVLKEILTKPPPTSGTVSTVKSLGARNAREEWEKVFNNHYIQPILENLDKTVGDAMNTILNDDNQDHDKLYYLVYERVKVGNHTLEPHLWSFRSRISLDHLGQTLQDAKMKKKHPILHEFLQAELSLRATQYLPDIVRLQQCLYDSFHHRLGRTDAMKLTIGEFLEEMKNENARNEYRERIESLQKAWKLVGQRLKTHTRLRVDDKYFIPEITSDTSLQYLIPTTTDAGVCTTALVDYLTLTHNDFIEKCRGIVTKNHAQSDAFWREHKVPITHIHGCHLLDYEQHFLSIVLSHCQYSLKLGKGCEIKYDHQALEKHILDRFIHGKPRILSDIPQVVYRKDIYTRVYFAAIRKKVRPQEPLTARMKQEILSELRTPDLLRDTLDVIDIVLGFLSSGGGRAGRSLREYIDKVLKMKKRHFSKKVRENCRLAHILSLWELVSVELAKLLWLKGEEPFDSVKDDFMRELSGEGSGDNQELKLYTCLRTYDLDRLLGTLYEFIETYVKHSPQSELEWPLVDTLDAFLMGSELPEIPQLTETFPDTITLAQAVSTWKHVVNYQAGDKLK